MNQLRVLALVGGIYDAAEQPEQWVRVLDSLGTALNTPSTVLHLQQTTNQQNGYVTAAVGMDPAAQERYAAYYSSINVWTIRGRHLLREGAVLTGQMICSDRELEATEYYADFLREQYFFHSIAAIPVQHGDSSLFVSALRPRHMGPFGNDAIALLRLLGPHLSRAARVHRHLSQVTSERQSFAEALDMLTIAIVLLDSRGDVVFANRQALSLVANNDGLTFVANRVKALRPCDTLRLEHAVEGARNRCVDTPIVHLPRRSGSPLHVLAVPLAHVQRRFGVPRVSVGLFITDPVAPPRPPEARLRELYGLTPAESHAAARLAAGASIQEIAAQQGLAIETIRTHIKKVLHKTEAKTQAQAVARVVSGLAGKIL